MILPADLQAKGLQGQTLVVLGTECGRTPRIPASISIRDRHTCTLLQYCCPTATLAAIMSSLRGETFNG